MFPNGLSNGHFGQFGLFLGTPGLKLGWFCSSQLVQKPWPGPPKVRSNFVPPCSSRLGPPEPSNRHFGQSGPIWAVFGHPWAEIGGVPLLQIGSKTLAWTSQSPFQLRSTLFQPFGTTRTFKPPFWLIWANLGCFWAVFGPWRSQISKILGPGSGTMLGAP